MADQRQPASGSNFQQNRPPVPGQLQGGSFPPNPQWNLPNQEPPVKMTGNPIELSAQFQDPSSNFPPRPGMPPNIHLPPSNIPRGPPNAISGHSQGIRLPNGPPQGIINGPSDMPPSFHAQRMPPVSMGLQTSLSSGIAPNTQFNQPHNHQARMPPMRQPARLPSSSMGQPTVFPSTSMGQPTGFPSTSMGQPTGFPSTSMGQPTRFPSTSMGHPTGFQPTSMVQPTGSTPTSIGQRMPPIPMGQVHSGFGSQPIVRPGPPPSGQNMPSQQPVRGPPPSIGQPSTSNQGMPPMLSSNPVMPPASSFVQTPLPAQGIFSQNIRPMSPHSAPGIVSQLGSPPMGNMTPPPMGSGINVTLPGDQDRPNELPVPYHGQAQYSHQIGPSMLLTPGNPSSEPPSNKSSRSATPISGQTYDALEGQFTPNKPVGVYCPSPLTSQPPVNQDMGQRSTGITGRRQYPQQAGSENQTVSNYSGNYQNKPVEPMLQPGGIPPYGNLQASTMPQTLPVSNSGYPLTNNPINPNNPNNLTSSFNKMGFNDTSQSQQAVNLLNERHLIHHEGLETVRPNLQHDFKKIHCNPEVFRCTLNAMPQSSTLLNKARLPLGILIHPFKDLSQLPVIQSSVIVRCRSCRTYINPYVHFVDQRRWKCNLCYRVNDLPEEFSFDPVSKTYGDPQRRPEIRSATIEFIAPSEYMLRPPQPAVYLYLLDVSFNAIETGYLNLFCQTLLDELDKIPGDSRTQIGFMCYDRSLYYFNLAEGLSQPQMLIVPDIEDVFLPLPDELLVNLSESKELVGDLLNRLPSLFEGNKETGSALGAALQSAYKLMSPTGGRISVMQTILPTVGQGALQLREATAQTSAKNIPHLGPATDFYKKLALDCSAQQIAVDLFMLNGQYADIASISCISKYSAGCIYHYPSFHTVKNLSLAEKYEADLRRYLTRKIGFESVMRIRCTRGLSIHTFHGNFFVRSTDLLSLPNINPDAAFGMQMSIEDTLVDCSTVCFQAALLYTSSKGERRIRVHTLCLPVTNQISDVYGSADQQAIICLLSKMAVDRSLTASMGDARDAMTNAAIDALGSYAAQLASSQKIGTLILPHSLRILPLFVLALLKSTGFKGTTNTRTDDRVFALQQFKVQSISYLLQSIYPHLYPVHAISEQNEMTKGGISVHIPPLIQLSSANIDRHGVYVMDTGDSIYMVVGGSVSDLFCQNVLDKPNFMSIPETMRDLPEMENTTSEDLRNFINCLLDNRPHGTTFLVMRDDSKARHLFYQHMVEDRTESSMSYYEFLQYLQQQVK